MTDVIERDAYYVIEGRKYPRFHTVAAAVGIIDTRWFTESGRNRGELIAILTALDDRGQLTPDKLDYVRERWGAIADQDPEAMQGYLGAWRSFRTPRDPQWGIYSVETVYWDERWGYATRPDRVYFGDETRALEVVEIKLGAEQPWYGLQLAAQAAAFTTREHITVTSRRVVFLSPDGTYETKCYTDDTDIGWWRGCLSTWNGGFKRGIYRLDGSSEAD